MKVELFVICVCLGIIVGGAMTSSFNDERQEEQIYCEMVNEGTWPNYKGLNCDNINK